MDKRWDISPRALIWDEQGRALLLRRSAQSRHWPGMWEMPGGKPDAGDTLETCLVREVREETGLEVALTRFLAAGEFEMPQVKLVLILMEVRAIRGNLQLSDEHSDMIWAGETQWPAMEIVPPLAAALRQIRR